MHAVFLVILEVIQVILLLLLSHLEIVKFALQFKVHFQFI